MDAHRVETLAQLQGVHKRYGGTAALAGLDLKLEAGRVLALLGPNGAGKTTAVSVLLGLCKADAGQATVFGQSPQSLAVRRSMGVMLQSAGLPETLRVRELLELARSYYPDPHGMADCIVMAGLEDIIDRRYGKLSGGQQRRVQFAMALCGRPRVLFLDEPTTGLDIEARQQVWQAIRRLAAQGSAVLLTTHYLEEAEALADHVAVMEHGRIVAEGTVQAIRARVARRWIRCVSALSAGDVARWPQVQDVIRNGDRLDIVAEAAEDVVRRLLETDPDLSELEVRRAGLADAFLHLTNESRQEAA